MNVYYQVPHTFISNPLRTKHLSTGFLAVVLRVGFFLNFAYVQTQQRGASNSRGHFKIEKLSPRLQ